MPYLTNKELRAVAVAWDELVSYIETVGADSDLDDEEMPQRVLKDAANDLRRLLIRHGVVAQSAVIL